MEQLGFTFNEKSMLTEKQEQAAVEPVVSEPEDTADGTAVHTDQSEEKQRKKEPVQFSSGAEKLAYEKEKCLESIQKEYRSMATAQYDWVFGILIKKCEESKEVDALVLQEHKSWKRCMRYAAKKAQEISKPTEEQKRLARTGQEPIVTPVGPELLFAWIDEYYQLDDKAEVEEEIKKEEEWKKRQEELKRKQKEAEEKRKKTQKKKASAVPAAKPALPSVAQPAVQPAAYPEVRPAAGNADPSTESSVAQTEKKTTATKKDPFAGQMNIFDFL